MRNLLKNCRKTKRILSIFSALFLITTMLLSGIPALFNNKNYQAFAYGNASEENRLLWANQLGNSYTHDIATDSSGNAYMIVDKSGTFKLIKYNSEGLEQWNKLIISVDDSSQYSYKVAVSGNGFVYICGGDSQITKVIKYTTDGEEKLVYELDQSLGAWPAISADSSGNLFVAGSINNGSKEYPNYQVILDKYNLDGNLKWSRQIGTDKYEYPCDITTDGSGRVYVIGKTCGNLDGNKPNGYSDAFISKFEADGTEQWIKQISWNSNHFAEPGGVATDKDGNIYMTVGAIYSWESIPFGNQWFVQKYSKDGKLLWSSPLPTRTGGYSPGIAVDNFGNAYTFGNYVKIPESGSTKYELLLTKFDASGKNKLKKELGASAGNEYARASTISIGKSGDVFLAGITNGPFFGKASEGNDAFIAKFEGDDIDTDGDGLLDKWEIQGYRSGDVFVDLPAMGADPKKKDIFVEIDWLEGHEPKEDAIKIVMDSFAKAPVDNPDGTKGINLHVDYGRNSIMNVKTGEHWGNMSHANSIPHTDGDLSTFLGSLDNNDNYNWSDFDLLKQRNFEEERLNIFRYCIFAHDLGIFDEQGKVKTVSGVAKGIPGSDFIVTLGSWANTIQEQAGTFMHELGHTLGLEHGGSDDINDKPNYLSIMNYSFQTTGLIVNRKEGLFDYSRFSDINVLDENNLNEASGVYSSSNEPCQNYWTRYYRNGNNLTAPLFTAVDWNVNGSIEPSVKESINGDDFDSDGNPYYQKLEGYNDWKNIKFKGGAVGAGMTNQLPAATPLSDNFTTAMDAAINHQYKVSVKAPGNSSIKAGETKNLTFTIKNYGNEADTYTLKTNSSMAWADLSSVTSSINLASGQSLNISIPVNIPKDAAAGTEEKLSLEAVSQGNDLIKDTASSIVVAKPNIEPVITKIDTGQPLKQTTPAIYDDKIVYTAYDNYNSGIYMYDLSTKTNRIILPLGYGALNPDIYGDKIAWQDVSAGGFGQYDIYMYDLISSTKKPVATTPSFETDVDIYGDKAVYVGYVGIYLADSSTGEIKKISSATSGYFQYPAIYGDKVVWYSNDSSSNTQIYMYDLAKGQEVKITNNKGQWGMRPDIYENNVVWSWSDGIYVYDISTNTTKKISSLKIKSGAKISIHGSKIVYVGSPSSTSGPQNIYMYDLTTDKETQITEDNYNEDPVIYKDSIVWTKSRELYMYNMPSDAPILPNTTLGTSPAAPDAAGGWFRTSPSITLTTDKPNTTTYYQWDSTSPQSWSNYSSAIKASEGEHTLYYYSTDSAGNKEAVKSKSFKVDSCPPETKEAVSPSKPDGNLGWYKSIPSLNLTRNEEGTTYYQWDSTEERGWKVYTEPVNGLEGEHTLYFYSMDSRGNKEEIKSYNLKVNTTIDTVPPTTIIITDANSPKVIYSESPLVTLKTDELSAIYYQWDSASGIGTSTLLPPYELLENTTPWKDLIMPGWKTYWGAFKVPKGVHTLYYYAVDVAGNVEAVKSKEFIVGSDISLDKEPPVTVITKEGTIGENNWYLSDVKITLTAADNEGGTGTKSTSYSFDGVQWNEYSQPFYIKNEGIAALKYRSVDNLGNEELIHEAVIQIDKSAPEITINEPLAGSSYYFGQDVTADWKVYDALSGISSSTGTKINGGYIDTGKVGHQTFTVSAKDLAGNEQTKTVSYYVYESNGGNLPTTGSVINIETLIIIGAIMLITGVVVIKCKKK